MRYYISSKCKIEKDRIKWIDIARAIGIFFIVLGHIPETGLVRQYIFAFHVPMFFLISGMCHKKEEKVLCFLKKKIKSIVIPYIFFSLVSIVIFWGISRMLPSITTGMDTNIFNNIKIMLWGNSKPSLMKYNLPLWFLPCFFCVNFLVFFMDKILKLCKVNERKMRIFLPILMIVCAWGGI